MELRRARQRRFVVIVAAGVLAACGSSTPVDTGATGTTGATATSTTVTTASSTTTMAGQPGTTTTATTAASGGSGGSGVDGHVLAGPTCPVERPDQPCPPRPVEGIVTALDGRGAAVASAPTDAAGHYALTVAPGHYTLRVTTPSGPFPRCPDTEVTVTAGTQTTVDIACDTGIR